MAKAKKQALSPEERLAQALVPEDEQPYEVPENWVWTYIGNICSFIGGGTPSKNIAEYWNGQIPWASVKDIKDNELFSTQDNISKEGLANSAANLCKVNDLLLVTRIEPGKSIISRIATAINQDLKIVRSYIGSEFLHYYFITIRHILEQKSSGSTVLGITISNVSRTEIPLPPRPEQQRIVERIESLFAKLDRAKELAQNALDTFETRKAAILHKAFTGELTAKWREANGVGMESWDEKRLSELSVLITKGASPKWQGIDYTDDKEQTLFVTSENVREGYIDLQKEKFLDNKINSIQKRSILKNGDLLLNIVGASIGRAAIFDIDRLANINQAVCLIRLKDNIDHFFINYYLNSPAALLYYTANKVDVARANLSLGDVSAIAVMIPSLPEQQEIVRILDSLFEKEQRAKELCDVIGKIDMMKKTVLARAFRGELGTNDPAEESALGLLKEVLA